MNKSDLLADLTAKGLRVIAVTQQSDPVKEAAGVNSYIANVLEQSGNSVTARNIGFYVMDEGDAGEAAYYRDQPKQKNTVYDVVQTYLDGLFPATYLRGKLLEVLESDGYAYAEVLKPPSTTGPHKTTRICIYKNQGSPIAHVEVE